MGKAIPMLSDPDPNRTGSAKAPTSEEVIDSIREDARRLLTPFSRLVQKQRGLGDAATKRCDCWRGCI